MKDKIYKNWNSITYIPPLIITVIIMIHYGEWYLFISYLLIALGWHFILILFTFLPSPFAVEFDKKASLQIRNSLDISVAKWKKYSIEEKRIFKTYSIEKSNLKQHFVSESINIEGAKLIDYENKLHFYENKPKFIKKFEEIFEINFNKLSFENKIKEIEDFISQRSEQLAKSIRDNEQREIRKNEIAHNLEKERILNEEFTRLKKEKEDQIIANNDLIIKKKIKEERLIKEKIQKQELSEQRQSEKDEQFKERVKRGILEKERKKNLESDAIQELINLGKLSDNYSFQNIRVPIPSHIKEAVWKRDKQICVNCESDRDLEFDHIIPVSKGGSNSINNIQLLCQKCNRTKTNKIM